jgi:prepilin signal peptidase PulO-like enzyme (type II secretory pathway)
LGPWAALPSGVIGFVVGWLSAWLTEWVTPKDETPSIRGRSRLVRDPLVQIGLALVWAAIPLLINGDLTRWVEAGLLAVPLVQVGVTDLRTRYVYTAVAAIGIALGLALGWHVHGVSWWWGLVGAAAGALAFTALYWLGRLVYRGGEPLARGDITIAALVGASAAMCVVQALFLGIVCSGVLALMFLVAELPRALQSFDSPRSGVLRRVFWALSHSRQALMPYGPGLCLGGLATLFLC